MIYTPEQSRQIIDTIQSVSLSNNGYTRFHASELIADAVRLAGFVVFRSTDLHGNPCWLASTKAAQESLRSAPYGVSTYKPIQQHDEGIDWEAAILKRQERQTMFD